MLNGAVTVVHGSATPTVLEHALDLPPPVGVPGYRDPVRLRGRGGAPPAHGGCGARLPENLRRGKSQCPRKS